MIPGVRGRLLSMRISVSISCLPGWDYEERESNTLTYYCRNSRRAGQGSKGGAPLGAQGLCLPSVYKFSTLGFPCWVYGTSAGCRVSLRLAVCNPEAV